MTAEFAIVVGAITAAYFVKGVAGMGGPLLAIPVIASVAGVEHAVVVLSLANLLSNGWLLWEHRAGAAGTGFVMIPFLTAGTIATVAGTWLLTEIDDRVLSVLVALAILGYIVRHVTDSEFRLDRARARRWAAPMGLVGGTLIGATGIGGPLIATYLHSIRFSRSSFIVALSLTFQVFGMIQIAMLLWLGSFTPDRTIQALWAILPVLAMTPLGIVLGRRLTQRWFEAVVLMLLAFAAIRLLVSAF
jgi:uncharacterized membrane protein YfcA